MKYREINNAPTRIVGAHLPPHLFQYVQGLAQIQNLSLSAVLNAMVQEHLDKNAKTVKSGKKR